jgi:DNA-binding NarL/FixJ family response regulator
MMGANILPAKVPRLVPGLLDGGELERRRPGPQRKYDPKEVLQFLADGETITFVAKRYNVTGQAIRWVLHRLIKKNGVKTTTQLVAHYLRNGWID